MKVLLNIHSLYVGGAETVVADYLLALKKQGHNPILVLDERVESFLQDRIDANGIRTISICPPCSRTLWGRVNRYLTMKIYSRRRWQKILEEEKPDVVHLHSTPWDLPFPTGRTAFTFHADVERNLSIFGKNHKKRLMKLARKGMWFFCLSDRAVSDIQRIFHTDHTILAPNGVDMERLRNNRYNRSEFLAEWNIPESAFVLGHVGRIHPVKNHQKIIEVFAEVVKRKDAYLLLVGTGDSEYTQTIKDLVNQYGLEKRVLFMGLRSDATKIMSIFDALVIPSHSESFSLTLVEAQALGIRCIVSDVVPEEVICAENVFALPLSESAQTWADYVLGDFVQVKDRSLSSFDMNCVIPSMVKKYEQLL